MDITLFENKILNIPSPIQEIHHILFDEADVRVFVKRDDLIHPIISGNKWRKLKEYIGIAKENPNLPFLSFGGAYSNHLYALAYVGHQFNIETIGIVRGDELTKDSNPYLKQMYDWGMQFQFINRTDYKNKIHSYKAACIEIPEGGYSHIGISGIKFLANELGNLQYDQIITAVGTGTTALGLSKYLNKPIIGILTLNNLTEVISHELEQNLVGNQWKNKYIMGKYAKNDDALNQFCKTFEEDHHISIEPVYTGRMFYGLYDLIKSNYFEKGSSILALHTGGIKLPN